MREENEIRGRNAGEEGRGMETLQAIARRTSVRKYRPEQIPEEALQLVLEAGMAAPVGSNDYKSLHLSVVQDAGLIKEIGDATNKLIRKMVHVPMDKRFGEPTMVLVSAKPGRVPGIEMANAATVLENMALAATDLGLGSVIWGGAASVVAQDPQLAAKLGIPAGFTPVLALSLGYAKKEQKPRKHEIAVNYAKA